MTRFELFHDVFLMIYVMEDKAKGIEFTNARLAKLVIKANDAAKKERTTICKRTN